MRKIAQHWKILLWMVAGVVVGGVFQYALDAPAYSGLTVTARADQDHVDVTEARKPADRFARGDKLWAVVVNRGRENERRHQLNSPADLVTAVGGAQVGDILWFEVGDAPEKDLVPLTLVMDGGSQRAQWVAPFAFCANIFMALLKMLIVPLVLTSIISGVAGVGQLQDLQRMGLKIFSYYIVTSLFAIMVGQTLVNIVQPGEGAQLGLPPSAKFADTADQSLWDVLLRMVPQNLFDALRDNGAMLQIIFFGLLFGLCITRAPDPHKQRMTAFFESAFEVMMRVAELVLKLIPYGVFCLMIKVVGESGFALFAPLAKYMVMVAGGLVLHACVILPLILKFMTGVSPLAWMRTMGPALMTAFSASSSSMTLPVTLECVEKRGRVSNRTSSFVLPLGATINMDGTALYECCGVIFLAQYYASTSGYELTAVAQFQVVFLALFASIGAAGIPSAGLIMMLTILTALGLPTEGAVILLAVDRPLDMMRTAVNVWSDSVGAAVIASSEGEKFGGPIPEDQDEEPPAEPAKET
ncbi:MAG: dicarboxylate/amino acid:cation symporter [Planctomycetota bacterium]|jgi:Na+/H+-dicarboxylate symporter